MKRGRLIHGSFSQSKDTEVDGSSRASLIRNSWEGGAKSLERQNHWFQQLRVKATKHNAERQADEHKTSLMNTHATAQSGTSSSDPNHLTHSSLRMLPVSSDV
ncbi:hypothetical protein CDAR_231831 [Caerostris darwini]|uniref:Uncharacterized protein n=1 Tax=Caerostris darwini TaxID=1538125 RepID=A0AAV4TYU3_9ARAC|nr:hypothetical protein CDAR_231831 [Caerostris darwini]